MQTFKTYTLNNLINEYKREDAKNCDMVNLINKNGGSFKVLSINKFMDTLIVDCVEFPNGAIASSDDFGVNCFEILDSEFKFFSEV